MLRSLGDTLSGVATTTVGVVTLNPNKVDKGLTKTVKGAVNTATLGIFREDDSAKNKPPIQHHTHTTVVHKHYQVNESKHNTSSRRQNTTQASAPALNSNNLDDDIAAREKRIAQLKRQKALKEEEARLQTELAEQEGQSGKPPAYQPPSPK